MSLSEKKLLENGIELLGWDELFTPIPNWNRYYISNYGRLLHMNKKKELKIVPAHPNNAGYFKYNLSKPTRKYNGKKLRDKNGKTKGNTKNCYVHRLVAELYVPILYPEYYDIDINDLEVHHRDKDPSNNYYKNLMYLLKVHHKFVDSIKRMGSYNTVTGRVYKYADIERLADKANLNVIEFIDYLRFAESEKDGKWNVYNINGYHIAVEYFKSK